MPPISKSDVRKQDFIVIKEKNNVDIARIVAPHELQVGIDGFKNTSLKVKGSGYIDGSLEVGGGVKGALKLPDGTLALRSGSGVKVADSGNGTVTLSLGSARGGIETIIKPGDGLISSVSNGVLTLALNRETTLPHFVEGTGVKISRLANAYTFALDASYIAATQAGVVTPSGSGLIGTATSDGKLSLSIDRSALPEQLSIAAGEGILFATGSNGTISISSSVSGSSAPNVLASDGISGSLSGETLTLSLDRSGLALLEGSIFTGQIVAQGGLSGSLTTLSDGTTPYLRAGSGIKLLTGSNGQIEIATSAGSASGVGTELVLNGAVTGTRDGQNLTFTLSNRPADPESFMLWLNGQLLTKDSDYEITESQIKFSQSIAPEETDVIRTMYSKNVSARLYAINSAPAQLVVVESVMTGLTLPNDPDPAGSLMLFLNGQLLTQGNDHDYHLNGRDVTFFSPASHTDVVRATYSYAV